jgi:hypothetical protein
MRPRPAHSAADAGGVHQDGAPAVPATGSRGRAGMFVLTAAAGLALAFGAAIGTPAAPATAAVAARTTVAAHAYTMFEPCPCADPLCREMCFQSMASGAPAAMTATPQLSGATTARHAVAGEGPKHGALFLATGQP